LKWSAYGGYAVIPDHMLGTPEYRRLVSDLPAPRLALNCIGGPTATEMARTLDKDGVFVTYGGMSKKPVQVPTSLFIFKNITFKGMHGASFCVVPPGKIN
jgi:trans-2-enoyl-CoA reductase